MLGRSLGNYHVVSKIGEGGMGAVYLARHVTLGRPAAIKVLHPSLSSNQDMVLRFFNEARAATAVRNPGIVEVFDFGVLEDRSAYIVMEYLEGENLGARIRRGRMAVPATLTIVRAIARALQAAHEQGIVHRDLKPDNVFLVPDAELTSGERVKLLDFGIAKLAVSPGEVSQTRTGMVMGTPTYMAPEQCRGAGSVDHRADLYALGCVTYQMLCGQPPFVSDGAGDLIARHLYFPPQPMRTLRPDIPAEVDDLVLWLLQKDPAARPANAADLVRTIDHLAAVSLPGVMHTQPPTRLSAGTFPPAIDTTLRGAASAVSLPGVPQSPKRTALLVGIGAGIVAVAVMLIIVVRGRGDDTLAGPAAPPAPPPPAAPATPLAATSPAATPPAAPAVTPPASPAITPSAAAPTTPAVTAATEPPATADRAERPERTDRTNGKRHSSTSRSHAATRDPELTPSAPEPEPPQAPAPAPTPPATKLPAPQAPPAEPPRPVPPSAPPVPAGHKAPPIIAPTAVTKLSGSIPAIKVKGISDDYADVLAKLCIDEQGVVSSVVILKALPQITDELQRGLQTWRYKPYIGAAGSPSPACFLVPFRVVFKG